MPIAFSPGTDHARLRECRAQVLAEMLQTRWDGGQWKFDEVLRRRTWKLYHRKR